MTLIYAFIIGGIICAFGQLILDKFKIMPIYITCLFVFIGGLLDFFNLYDKLIEIAGCGALLPISSFGHTITHGVVEEVSNVGFIGLFSGIFKNVSVGITAAIIFSFIGGLFFKPKG